MTYRGVRLAESKTKQDILTACLRKRTRWSELLNMTRVSKPVLLQHLNDLISGGLLSRYERRYFTTDKGRWLLASIVASQRLTNLAAGASSESSPTAPKSRRQSLGHVFEYFRMKFQQDTIGMNQQVDMIAHMLELDKDDLPAEIQDQRMQEFHEKFTRALDSPELDLLQDSLARAYVSAVKINPRGYDAGALKEKVQSVWKNITAPKCMVNGVPFAWPPAVKKIVSTLKDAISKKEVDPQVGEFVIKTLELYELPTLIELRDYTQSFDRWFIKYVL